MNQYEDNKGTPAKRTGGNIFPEIPSTAEYDDDNIPEIDTQNQIPMEMPGRNYSAQREQF